MNRHAPTPTNGTDEGGGGGLSSADLSALGIMGDVEPGSNTQPSNPDAIGVVTPDVPAAPAPAPKAPVTPTQPAAPIPLQEQSVIDRLFTKKGKSASRDYSGLDDRAKGLFERMSNEAYAELYPLYKRYIENKEDFDKLPELKQQLQQLKEEAQKPRDYYDHEHAYLLSPAYQNGLQERNTAEQVRDFWQVQLERLEGGQPFQVLIRQQQADGSYSLAASQMIDPKAPKARATILSELTKAESNYGAVAARLEETAKSIRGKYSNFNKVGEAMIQTYFGQYKDELKASYEKYLAKFAPELRNHPAMRFSAYALAALEHATANDNKSSVRAAADAANRAASVTSGPTAAEVEAGLPPKVPKVTDEEYNRFKSEFGI